VNVLEIVPSWPPSMYLLEHIYSLHASAINLVLGNTNSSDHDITTVNSIRPSQFFTPVYDLTKFSWQANFRKLDKMRLSNVDKNLSYIIDKHQPDLIHFHSSHDAIQHHHKAVELSIPYTVSLNSSDIYLEVLEDEAYLPKLYEMLKSTARIHISYEGLASDVEQIPEVSAPITTIRIAYPKSDVIPNSDNMPMHLISAGELTWQNGFHDLVRAMIHLPNMSLDIIGTGFDYRHLVFLIHTYNLQDRVQVLENITFDSCRDLIGKATAYVHSGIVQEVSEYLLLAMSMGKPVFVTNNVGMDELVEDRNNGIYIPIGEVVGMAKQLKTLADVDLMQKIGNAARTSVEKMFVPQTHTEKFIQFYQSACHDMAR